MEALEARLAELERRMKIRELQDSINYLELHWMSGGPAYLNEAQKLKEQLKQLTPSPPEEIQAAMRARLERMEGDNKAKLRKYLESIGVKFDPPPAPMEEETNRRTDESS